MLYVGVSMHARDGWGEFGSWLVGSTRAKRNLKSFVPDSGSGVDTALKSCRRRAKRIRLPSSEWELAVQQQLPSSAPRAWWEGPLNVPKIRLSLLIGICQASPLSTVAGTRPAGKQLSVVPPVCAALSLLSSSSWSIPGTAELPNPTHHTCVQPFRLRLTAVTHRIILAASTSFIYLFGRPRHYYSSGRNHCRQRSRPLAEPVDFIFARPYSLDHNCPRRHWHNI